MAIRDIEVTWPRREICRWLRLVSASRVSKASMLQGSAAQCRTEPAQHGRLPRPEQTRRMKRFPWPCSELPLSQPTSKEEDEVMIEEDVNVHRRLSTIGKGEKCRQHELQIQQRCDYSTDPSSSSRPLPFSGFQTVFAWKILEYSLLSLQRTETLLPTTARSRPKNHNTSSIPGPRHAELR